jgi:hypothetical protein
VATKSALPNNYKTSTSSSSTATTPHLLGGAKVPSFAPLLLRYVTTESKENSRISILASSTENDLALVNPAGAREAPKLLTHETNLPLPIILQSSGSAEEKNMTPPEGSVRKRVEEIETSWGANHKQPPSMYTSVVAPLEVWVVQEPNSYAYPTIFYKTPQVLPCDSIIRLPLFDIHTEQVVNTIRADPRLVHLLEKIGIKLQRNYMLPSPPAICEEWWDETERLIRKKNKKGKNKTQPKYDLCYAHGNSSTSEEDGVNDQQRVVCRMTSVILDQHEECDEFCEEDDNPTQRHISPVHFVWRQMLGKG